MHNMFVRSIPEKINEILTHVNTVFIKLHLYIYNSSGVTKIGVWVAFRSHGAAVARAVWGRALLCCKKATLLRNPRHLDLITGRGCCLKGSINVTLVTVLSLGM